MCNKKEKYEDYDESEVKIYKAMWYVLGIALVITIITALVI